MEEQRLQPGRIASLDQFRGYTIAGMYLVNLIGGRAAMPAVFTHHGTYCSYADLIMPHFFFAVGFAYRLSFLRRLDKGGGAWAASRHAIGRCFGLVFIGVFLYQIDGSYPTWNELCSKGISGVLVTGFGRGIWQALVHIAATSLWLLPVIAARPVIRAGFLVGTGGLHLLLSYLFYYDFATHGNVIDGGPLGFMSWAVPTLAGTFAYDLVVSRGAHGALKPAAGWSVILMLAGYGIACLNAVHHALAGDAGSSGIAAWLVEPPFMPPSRPVDLWTMCQGTGSVSYMTFSAGASLAIYALFVWVCDVGTFQLGLFRTLGGNALAAYVIGGLFETALGPFIPNDSPLWYVLAMYALYLAIMWRCMRYLEKNNLYLRL